MYGRMSGNSRSAMLGTQRSILMVTFRLRRLVPIHLAVEYTTPHDPRDDTRLGLDVTIKERLVEFLDDFRQGLDDGHMNSAIRTFNLRHTCRSLANDVFSDPSSSVIILGTNLVDR